MASNVRAYARLAPELWGTPSEVWYLPEGPIADLIVTSGLFASPERKSYNWRRSIPPGRSLSILALVQATHCYQTTAASTFCMLLELRCPIKSRPIG
jgi:hypothetical protein